VLREQLEAALTPDGQPPPPGSKPRVKVSAPTKANHERLTVTWSITPTDDGSIPVDAAYQDAANLLAVIQSFDGLDYERVSLRGTYPLSDTNGDGTPDSQRVILLRFFKATLDSIDFDTLDPLTLPDVADGSTIDPAFQPPSTTTTSSSSSSSSTTTTT